MIQHGVAMNAKQRSMFHHGVRDVREQDSLLRKSISRSGVTSVNTRNTPYRKTIGAVEAKSENYTVDDQVLAIVSNPIKKNLQKHTEIVCVWTGVFP